MYKHHFLVLFMSSCSLWVLSSCVDKIEEVSFCDTDASPDDEEIDREVDTSENCDGACDFEEESSGDGDVGGEEPGDSDSGDPDPDSETIPPPCGDGYCDPAESCGDCPGDCGDCSGDVLAFPIRGAFYYPWFPETWQTTDAQGNTKPVDYHPDLGYYNSDSQEVAEFHLQAMDYAKIEVAILSWWGPETHHEQVRVPLLLEQTKALGSKLKWAVYYEKVGFPETKDIQLETIKSDLAYLKQRYVNHETFAHIDGKPVLFAYNKNLNSVASCDITDRFLEAANDEWYVVLKIFGERDQCQRQPDTWHQYGPSSPALTHTGVYYAISPGFWKSAEEAPRLPRDIDRWRSNIRDMIAADDPWQLITTFNEWGEGTAVEPASEWASPSGFGQYLDALHSDGVEAALVDLGDGDEG